MTNRIAIWILLILATIPMVDLLYLHWGIPLFVAGRLMDLIEYLAFWR